MVLHTKSLSLLLRGMVGDEELRRAHTAVFTLMTSGSAATHTPYPPSIAAMDAVNALLVDAKLQYQSVTCILEVSTACSCLTSFRACLSAL